MVEHNIELIGTVIIGILGLSLIVQGYFIVHGKHQYKHSEREQHKMNSARKQVEELFKDK